MECNDARKSVSWITLIQCLKDAEFSNVGLELEEIFAYIVVGSCLQLIDHMHILFSINHIAL